MGQICPVCGFREEPRQAAAFEEISTDTPQLLHSRPPSSCLLSGQQSPPLDFNGQPHASRGPIHLEPGRTCEELNAIEENERQRKLAQFRLEQVELARREAIVTTASQSMVPVGPQGSVAIGVHRMINHHHSHHRGGGMNSYYDPAYAAAAAQDILRSAAMTGGLVFCSDQATLSAWKVSMIGHMPVLFTSQDKGPLAKPKDVIEALGRGRWDGVRLGSRGSGLAGCGGEDPEYYLDDLAEAFLETMVPTKNSLLGGCASIVENLP